MLPYKTLMLLIHIFNSNTQSHVQSYYITHLIIPSKCLLKNFYFSGTKWCGTGDIATTYHDLGSDKDSDKCCRTHDLCPVKIRAFKQRYNLTNNSLYTK